MEVCHRIISGDILVHELKTISHKESQMGKLCAAATPSEQKNDGKESSPAEDMPSYSRVKMQLDLRIKELDCFNTYRAQLTHFLHKSASVTLAGNLVLRCNDAYIVELCAVKFCTFITDTCIGIYVVL